MILHANNTTYAAHFKHEQILFETRQPMTKEIVQETKVPDTLVGLVPYHDITLAQWATLCTVHKGPCATQTRPCDTPHSTIAVSLCSKTEPFDRGSHKMRYEGRKRSFHRAIQKAGFDKETRRALMQDFLRQNHILEAESEAVENTDNKGVDNTTT